MSAQLIAFPSHGRRMGKAQASIADNSDWYVCRKIVRDGTDTHWRRKLANGWHFDLHQTGEGWQVFVNAPVAPYVGRPYPASRNIPQPRKPDALFRSFDEAQRYANAYVPLTNIRLFIPPDHDPISQGRACSNPWMRWRIACMHWPQPGSRKRAPGWLSEDAAALGRYPCRHAAGLYHRPILPAKFAPISSDGVGVWRRPRMGAQRDQG